MYVSPDFAIFAIVNDVRLIVLVSASFPDMCFGMKTNAAIMQRAATTSMSGRWGLSQPFAALCSGSDSALVGHMAPVAAQQDIVCD